MIDCSVSNQDGLAKTIFTVPLMDRDPVYMSFDLRPHMSDTWAAVIVDSTKFLDLWRNEHYSVHREFSMGNPDIWRHDKKYPDAEIGFQMGLENPVPLAYVSFKIAIQNSINYKFLWFGKTITSEMLPSVGFTNGITRTIWLLSNEAKSFPIKCELPGAEELNKYAGVAGGKVLRISELLENT
ncbi:MAG: hypothetical protein PHE60_07435 [Sulfurospirillaceae bacterium]|nr:hypothetical protein [Sulfurospirillaceae bacterium]